MIVSEDRVAEIVCAATSHPLPDLADMTAQERASIEQAAATLGETPESYLTRARAAHAADTESSTRSATAAEIVAAVRRSR